MKTEQEIEEAAAKLSVQVKEIFHSKLCEMLMQGFGYQGTYRVLLGASTYLLADCLTNETIDCDGTAAREPSPEAGDEERQRRFNIAVRVVAESTEEFLRRIYANRN